MRTREEVDAADPYEGFYTSFRASELIEHFDNSISRGWVGHMVRCLRYPPMVEAMEKAGEHRRLLTYRVWLIGALAYEETHGLGSLWNHDDAFNRGPMVIQHGGEPWLDNFNVNRE